MDYDPRIEKTVEKECLRGFEDGKKDDYTEGYGVGFDDGRRDGYNEGYDVGFDDGRIYGYSEGYSRGLFESNRR
jgi:flagellar biosynthesis/type III secretory pathway protein FliH